jgi:glycerophosphoryl diester phosphodiesterase
MTATTVWAVLWVAVTQPAFDFFKTDTPERPFAVMAHRGRMDLAPENTVPAIQACIDQGYEWVEIDVRLTRDGRHIVFHDSSVDGKTDGHGAVSELTLDEIKRLDAGIRFSDRFAGEKILTFAELLQLGKGRINVYVDCKDIDPGLLTREILDAGMERQVVVFDELEVLAEVTRYSEGKVPIMPKWHPEFGIEQWVNRVKPAAVEIDAEDITKEICQQFQNLGVVVQAKVLNENDRPEVWRRLLGYGVEWFQTDRPDDLIAECSLALTHVPTPR